MEEYWSLWNSNLNFELAEAYYFAGIVDDCNGMMVFLTDFYGVSRIKVEFPGRVQTYKYTEELACLKTMSTFCDESGKEINMNKTFFEVKHSKYANLVADESQGIYPLARLIHFAIICGGGVFEVITDREPVIVPWTESEYTCDLGDE